MTEKEIEKMIEKAKTASENSFIPYSEIAVGASVLTSEKILFSGCAVDTPDQNFKAALVAILKAVSEGQVEIKAVCAYRSGKKLPYLSGIEREIVWQFGKKERATVILACDEMYEKYHINELLPFSRLSREDEE